MKNNINRLVKITEKNTRNIIGLMSGTSLDGLDVALCEISGSGLQTQVSLKEFHTISYDQAFRDEVRKVFSKKLVDLQQLCLLNEYIGSIHAKIVNESLAKWNIDKSAVDLIASHGQTIFHAPKSHHGLEKFGNGTLQIGDGDHIAFATGIITISDFRQKHIAAGAEGAPLAVYGDYVLFSKKEEDRILLNIGGIANFTFLPGNLDTGQVICTDTGPGNTLMDASLRDSNRGVFFDQDAEIAKQGTIHEGLLKALKDDAFFNLPIPRTTGPELFNQDFIARAKDKAAANNLSLEDTLRTLNSFTADTIAAAIRQVIKPGITATVICSGGGIHNPLLMDQLKAQLSDCIVRTTQTEGIRPDAKEAVLFAILANEAVCGDPAVFLSKSGNNSNLPAVTMGKICFP